MDFDRSVEHSRSKRRHRAVAVGSGASGHSPIKSERMAEAPSCSATYLRSRVPFPILSSNVARPRRPGGSSRRSCPG